MIQDPTIETAAMSGLAGEPAPNTEEAVFVAFVNAERDAAADPLTLNTSTGDLSASELETVLRSGCSVLIKTPQFLLAHLTPRGYSDNDTPGPPRLAACLPGEPCGYTAICNHWRSRLSAMGHTVVCTDRSVRKGIRFFFPGYFGTFKIAEKIEIGPLVPVSSLTNRRQIAEIDENALTLETRLVITPPKLPDDPKDPVRGAQRPGAGGPLVFRPSDGDPVASW